MNLSSICPAPLGKFADARKMVAACAMTLLGLLSAAAPAAAEPAYQVLDNDLLRFGTGAAASVNASGNLLQPFYWDGTASQWYRLTFSSYPLDTAIGIDGDGASEWNINGTVVEPTLTNQVLDISGHTATSATKGYGRIVSTGTVTIGDKTLELRSAYELPADKSFVKITTRLTNTSAASIGNVRLWVGTRDDYVGTSDRPTKLRGNLVDGTFTAVSSAATQATALKISSNATGVLFYSTSPKAHTSINSCCGFSNSYRQNPATSAITASGDGSYALFVRMADLAPGTSEEFTWYYAAGSLDSLDSIVGDVAVDTGNSGIAVTASAGTGGTIDPGSATVASGSTTTFNITPNAGYRVADVAGCNGTLSGGTFTTGAITSACEVTASFSRLEYTVSATADTGGSITPASVSVLHGEAASFAVSAATGYSISGVTGCSGTLNGATFTTAAIAGTCSITASFHRTEPTFGSEPPASLELHASQLLTQLPGSERPQALAFDGTELEVTLVDAPARYEPGRHVLTWQATDARGVRSTVQQILYVWPTISLGPDMTIGGQAGNSGFFRIALNGPSPVYPLTVNYAASGDLQGHDLQDGQVVFDEGETQKEVGFAVLHTMTAGSPDRHVQLTVQDDAGRNSRPLTVTFTSLNKAPTITLSQTQDGVARPAVARDGGPISLDAYINDPNSNDTHTLRWSGPSGAVFTTTAQGITIDPASLPVGVHRFELVVTDNGTPQAVSRNVFELVVLETVPALPAGATQFLPNGLPDHPGYAPRVPNVLPERSGQLTHHLMESDPGTRLALGAYAVMHGQYQTELASGVTGSRLVADSINNVGGYFDFVVSDLPVAGASTGVVIPQRAVIPAQPVYRKFDNASGRWQNFVEDDSNRLASAAGEEGFCPPPSSSAYRPGLNPGDWCVRLTIRDGGPNDADNEANGSVVDPGGVGSLNNVVVTGKSRGSGGGGSFNFWLLSAGLAIAALRGAKRSGRWTSVAALSTLSMTATADEQPHWYAGATLGQARSDISEGELTRALQALGHDATASVDDARRTAWRVHAGYQWNSYLALEAGYVDLGELETRFAGAIADVPQFVADTNHLHPVSGGGFDLAAVARYDFASRAAITARAGMFVWDADIRTDNASVQTVKRKDDGSDALFGVGVEVNLYRNLSLHIEGTRYGIDHDHIDFVGAGIAWRWR
ncbi:outer membrane beta-barrel protein [Povalibacter sp.]|uniref:outer membrane beta-barrel protein n=1 Tax=Povalibacter sp. TaxID=1962978 RepID=UPI002F42A74D